MIKIKNKDEINLMKKAGNIVSQTLSHLEQFIKPGIETIELDSIAEDFIRSKDAIPGFKGLYGFPGTLCVSIEDEVVHGVPSNRELKNGEIISIDVGSIYEEYYGDHAKTFAVGKINDNKKKLMNITRESLMIGIDEVAPNKHIGDIKVQFLS